MQSAVLAAAIVAPVAGVTAICVTLDVAAAVVVVVDIDVGLKEVGALQLELLI